MKWTGYGWVGKLDFGKKNCHLPNYLGKIYKIQGRVFFQNPFLNYFQTSFNEKFPI